MGILVTVDCPSFHLPSSRYADALAAIQELAERSPAEFDDPEAVAGASDLLAALDSESWSAETDATGITKLSYVADEAAFMEKGLTIESGNVADLTAQDAEIHVTLAPGPEPLDLLRARVPAHSITWDPARRTLRLCFHPTPTRVAEDVITEVLRALLEHGARISALGKGRSLEQRYLEAAPPP